MRFYLEAFDNLDANLFFDEQSDILLAKLPELLKSELDLFIVELSEEFVEIEGGVSGELGIFQEALNNQSIGIIVECLEELFLL